MMSNRRICWRRFVASAVVVVAGNATPAVVADADVVVAAAEAVARAVAAAPPAVLVAAAVSAAAASYGTVLPSTGPASISVKPEVTIMAKVLVLGVALCACVSLVMAGVDPCTTVNQTLTDAAGTLLTAYNNMTATDKMSISKVMTLMCNTVNKPKMLQIQVALGSNTNCISLVTTNPNLKQLTFAGISFSELLVTFKDIDEACNCGQYMDQAFILRMQVVTKTITNGYFASVGDPGIVCKNQPIAEGVPRVRDLITYVSQHIQHCAPLWNVAGWESRSQIDNSAAFIAARCDRFVQNDFNCAETASTTAAFKTCMNKYASTGSVSDSEVQTCGRRACVTEAMKSCTGDAVDTFVFVANILSQNKQLAKDPCSAASTLHLSALAVLLVFLVSFLK